MSERDTILGDFKTLLEGITRGNGFNNNVRKVERKMLFIDQEDPPVLMILGGAEDFDDLMDGSVYSSMDIKVRGYSRDPKDPEEALCNLLEDVLTRLEDSSENSHHANMSITGLETDEGWIHMEAEGVAMFEIAVKVDYKFTRGSP